MNNLSKYGTLLNPVRSGTSWCVGRLSGVANPGVESPKRDLFTLTNVTENISRAVGTPRAAVLACGLLDAC